MNQQNLKSQKSVKQYLKQARRLNPHLQPLTAQQLKAFPSCEKYTDQEADDIIQSLERLALVAFETMEMNLYIIDNQ